MGRKAVGPVCCVMHVKEPTTLIVKEKGLAPVFVDSRLEHPAGWICARYQSYHHYYYYYYRFLEMFHVNPQMPEEQAFAVLTKTMYDYHLRDLFMNSFVELHVKFYQLERLMEVSRYRVSYFYLICHILCDYFTTLGSLIIHNSIPLYHIFPINKNIMICLHANKCS